VPFAWLALGVFLFQTADTRPSFSEWLTAVRAEALSRGIRQEIVDQTLSNIDEPVPTVLDSDRRQAEVTLSLDAYLARILTPKRIAAGREQFVDQRALLEQVGKKYGVAPRIIASIWGIESAFGRQSGTHPVIAALATLAWDPRRATFFRNELFNALEILNRGDIEPEHMKGSWAGAMGQTQFMPSSYLKFAEDYDGDGRRDIWSTPGDVFASIANYLKGHGWTPDETWGREVRVTPQVARRVVNDVARRNGSCRATRDMTVALPMARWEALGVRLPGGKALPKTELQASLVSGKARHFLVYRNYDAILEYNCAHSYALSVALLGDRIAAGPPARAVRVK
jgi:membrane-bound lytic murein transglycosylase B